MTQFLVAQNPSSEKEIILSGNVTDASTKQPLEYATIILKDPKTQKISGGITDVNGKFNIQIPTGNYEISVEFISFKPIKIPAQNFTSDKNLGTFRLKEDLDSLDEVVIIAEKTTVDIRLDKKVFNIGKDLSIRGGNASDVLGNVPSVQVDVEGNISLRGNENVTILIDGRPSALVGINGADALRQIPAEAIEKVEVITSPSSRYDAEGTAGILNIILRKNQLKGFNGSLQIDLGIPERYGSAINANLRFKKWNFFTNTGFRYNTTDGNAFFDTKNFLSTVKNARVIEKRNFSRLRRSLFTSFGTEYFINDNSSIIANVVYNLGNDDDVNTNNTNRFDISDNLNSASSRIENESEDDHSIQYTLDYVNNFDSKGKKLSINLQYSTDLEDNNSTIIETETVLKQLKAFEKIFQEDDEKNALLQVDYVHPIGENIQYEAGYRGNYRDIYNSFFLEAREDFVNNGPLIPNDSLNNAFGYKEFVNAAYFQYGHKVNKVSILAGLRYEHSSIETNQFTTDSINKKNFGNLFPTVNIGFELNDSETLTIGYNKRIRRPRGYFLNPFPSRSSESNIFSGNVNLNPVLTDAIDIGYLKRWDKFTLSTSIYYNKSNDNWEFIQENTGEITRNGDPILRRFPINLSTSERVGFEFTLSYKPFKAWNINSDFNLFSNKTKGSYTNESSGFFQNFDFQNTSYFIRLNQKISLLKTTDIQINSNYRGASQTAQSKNKGIFSMDIAASKELFKEKATISFNVGDVFNGRKRKSTTIISGFSETYSEFQWRERQISMSFVYRFNQSKPDKKRNRDQEFNGGGDEIEG